MVLNEVTSIVYVERRHHSWFRRKSPSIHSRVTPLSYYLPQVLQSAHPFYSWRLNEYSEYGLQMKRSIIIDRAPRQARDWLASRRQKMDLATFVDRF